jgi:hypothetical protein
MSMNIRFQSGTPIRMLAHPIMTASLMIKSILMVLRVDMKVCRTETTWIILLVATCIILMGVTAIITGP